MGRATESERGSSVNILRWEDCAHTQLAAGIPEGLRVEVGGVHAVGRRVDAGELPLVEVDEGCGFLLHYLVSFGLTER